jgi:hypothetical protein
MDKVQKPSNPECYTHRQNPLECKLLFPDKSERKIKAGPMLNETSYDDAMFEIGRVTLHS